MSLDKQLRKARKRVVTDGYEMSLGELISSYKSGELNINPNFQRLYRWDLERKTRFIESLLLRIPTPPIFVFTRPDSTWELVDGLQRLSTILEFVGELKDSPNMEAEQPLRLLGTKLLPDLAGKSWTSKNGGDGLTSTQQLDIRRARIRLEILLKDSDEQTKYELFQRLNTGGSQLSNQEVRNCVLIMVNPDFFSLLQQLSESQHFVNTVRLSERQENEQLPIELVLRFVAFSELVYEQRIGVHEFLDDAAVTLADGNEFNHGEIKRNFTKTFQYIDQSLGESAFKAYRNKKFQGRFSISAFEVVTVGVAENLHWLTKVKAEERSNFIRDCTERLWKNKTFKDLTKAGVTGARRLTTLLPMAHEFFAER